VITPQYLVQGGAVQWEAMRALFTQATYPTRNLAENLADLNAALASIRAGEQALRELVRLFGRSQVRHYMTRLKDYSAQNLRAQWQHWPDGTYRAQEQLDDGSPLVVAWHIAQGQLRLDLSGSAPTHPGNLNANRAIVNSAVLYVLRLLLGSDIPLNEGLMQGVEIYLPEGMLNPVFPADPHACPAVVGGNVETSQRLVDTLLKALAVAACSQGTMNNLLFGNERLGYYETIGGGTGAGPGFGGADGVHQHMTNTRITDPEILELRYPVRLEAFGLRRGSGGKGQFPGGAGIQRRIRFLEAMELTLLTQHRTEGPYGLHGGEAGALGQQWIIRADGTRQALAGIAQAQMQVGDAVEIWTPGGGGWGRPEEG